jgi:pantothenate kinase
VYSFAEHARLDRTTTIYSPHVLILEGIFALHDPRVLELLDMAVRPTPKQPSGKPADTVRFIVMKMQILA